jgi:hypothetical protein
LQSPALQLRCLLSRTSQEEEDELDSRLTFLQLCLLARLQALSQSEPETREEKLSLQSLQQSEVSDPRSEAAAEALKSEQDLYSSHPRHFFFPQEDEEDSDELESDQEDEEEDFFLQDLDDLEVLEDDFLQHSDSESESESDQEEDEEDFDSFLTYFFSRLQALSQSEPETREEKLSWQSRQQSLLEDPRSEAALEAL